jgi:peptide/nickel transport system ATP-binding protein
VMYAGQALETAPIDAFFHAPTLPYTRLLLDSLPSGDAPLRGIAGDVPSLVSAPPGCRFHPRCPRASEICRMLRPAVSEIAPGHSVRCHHPLVTA